MTLELGSAAGFTTPPPSDPAAQLQWLVDRACISDLLADFARRIDTHDQAGYAANFTEDAVLALPFGRFEGRDAIAAMTGPPPPMATHHLSTNHQIEIDGDVARSRSYLQATHVRDEADPTKCWKAGGWYDCAYRRDADRWRFTSVELTIRWTDQGPAF